MERTLELNSGAVMPAIGFGTWKLLPDAVAETAVASAIAAGYRLIDTARLYQNEAGVGAAIRDSQVPRGELFVTTKLWNSDQGYDSALTACQASLDRLGLDSVDLYLIHWPQNSRLTRDTWRAMQDLLDAGQAGNIGVSNFSAEQIEEMLDYCDTPPAVNQIEFNPFVYERQRPTLEYCLQNSIVVEAYSPLAQAEHLDHPVIAEIAKARQKTGGQVLLRWALQHGTVPIPKTARPERMRENLAVFDFDLSAAEMAALNAL